MQGARDCGQDPGGTYAADIAGAAPVAAPVPVVALRLGGLPSSGTDVVDPDPHASDVAPSDRRAGLPQVRKRLWRVTRRGCGI
jgi:hypothetical protein